MHKLNQYWIDIRSSLWFVPLLIVSAAVVLAIVLVRVDSMLGSLPVDYFPGLFGTEPAASRDLLSIVASSMLSVASIVFSITVVALVLASTQFTPRILRNFMRDKATQFVIGVFIGIFVYSLVVLRTIRDDPEKPFVPVLAVGASAVLGVLAMVLLIYFVHHIAQAIQASNIIATIRTDTMKVIDELYPRGETPRTPSEIQAITRMLDDMAWCQIPATSTGYLQSFDVEGLMELARSRRGVLRMERRVGEFIAEGTPLARLSTGLTLDQADPATIEQLNDLVAISAYRTIEQDVAFGIRQIVDIALKALSPAINDTTTGLTCVDHSSAIMVRLAERPVGSFYHYDGDQLRLVARGQTIEDFMDLTFNQIRQNAGGNVAIMLRLLVSLEAIALTAHNSPNETEIRDIVTTQTRMITALADRTIPDIEDRIKVHQRIHKLCARVKIPVPEPLE